jgi:DNA-binding NarL/FixJ family response regulator
MSNPIRVIVGEDSFLVREGIVSSLQRQANLDVVAAEADLDALRSAIDRLEPDCVVTDIRMPPTGTDEGLQIAATLRRTHPNVGVVLLSQFTEPQYGLALLEDGSDRRAYLLKEHVRSGGQLVAAIEAVAAGGSLIDARVVDGLIAERRRGSSLAELTPRELEILACVARGHNNQAIADELVLTKRAVEKHINAIFSKLDLPDESVASRRVHAALLFLSEQHEGSRPHR